MSSGHLVWIVKRIRGHVNSTMEASAREVIRVGSF